MDLEPVRYAMQVPAKLLMALDLLEGEMPVDWETGGVRESLLTLRDNISELALREIGRLGPQEYLIIKPLAPDAWQRARGTGRRACQSPR